MGLRIHHIFCILSMSVFIHSSEGRCVSPTSFKEEAPSPPRVGEGAGERSEKKASIDTVRTLRGTKSPRLAAFMSLILPGAGQAYAGGGKSARFFLFSEGAIWAGNLGFRLLARARDRAFKGFSAAHAGVRPHDKGARYFDDVASYQSIYVRNSVARYQDGPAADLIPETPDNLWEWDSEASMRRFQRLRSASTAARRDALLCVGGLVLNRFAGAIHAAYVARNSPIARSAVSVTLVPDFRGGWAFAMSRTF